MTTLATPPVTDVTRVVLTDGRTATLRRLSPTDADALADAVARADPWDLRKRFMGAPPPIGTLIRRLNEADGVHDLVVGAFSDEGRLVAVAQFDRVDDEPAAEIAVEVAKDWQHQGLGTKLVTFLADLARALGIHHFTATFYADNFAIRRLLRDVAPIVASSFEAGEGYADLDLDSA